jgi:hypothetical protein
MNKNQQCLQALINFFVDLEQRMLRKGRLVIALYANKQQLKYRKELFCTYGEDKQLDNLAIYFQHFNIQDRYKITFESFVRQVQQGTWEARLA